MSIKVRYFASLKDQLGHAEAELPVNGPVSARWVWQQLNPEISLPDGVLSAINLEYAQLDSLVSEGDELAFFPPVTGG